jgi:hypothetical protein
MTQQVVPEILKGSGRVAYGFLKGGIVASVRFNGRRFSVMGEYPIVTTESEDKGMCVAIVYGTAGTKTDMADNNSAFYHMSQFLETVVNIPGNKDTLG